MKISCYNIGTKEKETNKKCSFRTFEMKEQTNELSR